MTFIMAMLNNKIGIGKVMKGSGAENVRSGEINPVTLIGLHRRGF